MLNSAPDSRGNVVELLDVYDANKIRSGKIICRGDEIKSGEHILVAHLCVFNSKGEMLIQRRSLEKDRYPGCWDVSAGGFVKSGESSEYALIRETKEELGISVKAPELEFIMCETFSFVLDDFFFLRAELDTSGLKIQPQELSKVKYAPAAEIMSMLESGRFVDYSQAFMMKVFDFEKSRRLNK